MKFERNGTEWALTGLTPEAAHALALMTGKGNANYAEASQLDRDVKEIFLTVSDALDEVYGFDQEGSFLLGVKVEAEPDFTGDIAVMFPGTHQYPTERV